MAEKRRFPRAQAEEVARQLRKSLEGACQRIQVAGSLRRGLPEVGDIELVCISRQGAYLTEDRPPGYQATFDFVPGGRGLDLPWETRFDPEYPALDVAIDNLMGPESAPPGWGILAKRLDARGRATCGPKNKLLVHVKSGIPVDVFTTTPENWGMALLVRTGPAEFNIRVMSALRRKGMRGHAYGGVSVPGRGEVECPEEETVFRLLGWPYLPPQKRT